MKQVPRENSVKINPDLSINAEGIEQIMNLFDEYAVEEALQWNEKLGGKVTILSLGPEAWKEQIRRALAMGATDALLLSDPAFATLDVLGAARAVAAAITKLGDVDLVIAGRNSTDDESGAFGPALARSLGWPQLTYVGKIAELDEGGKRIVAERYLEEQGIRRKLVFSGDLGQYDTPILKDAECIDSADVVLMESTYGSRRHRDACSSRLGTGLPFPCSVP
jgi:electron transfer flavoprotein beta subunit